MFACQLFWLLLICSDGVQRPESETEATEMFVLEFCCFAVCIIHRRYSFLLARSHEKSGAASSHVWVPEEPRMSESRGTCTLGRSRLRHPKLNFD